MRSIVVAGATAGIGLAIAERFAKGGGHVAILARDTDRLDAKCLLRTHGGNVIALPVDVADPVAVDVAADRAATELGGVDAWVNYAMSTVIGSVDAITLPRDLFKVTATSGLHGFGGLARFGISRGLLRFLR